MPTYRLTLEYEGTRYHGWQEQASARSVAGDLRRAIEAAAGRVQELGGSGRTDAGVHALAQTAHLRLPQAVDLESFRRDVNDQLPADIHLLAISLVDNRFHARHSAASRSYLYQISRRRTAFGKRYVWWVKRPLDLARMEKALSLLPGRHDFVRFCEHRADQTSTLVEVEEARLARFGALVVVRLVASHFLWKMVRRVIGTLVEVGAGQLDAEAFRALLSGRTLPPGRGSPAEWTAPPSGLFLERVRYPGDPPLAPLSPALSVSSEETLPASPRAAAPAPPGGGRRPPRASLRKGGSAGRGPGPRGGKR